MSKWMNIIKNKLEEVGKLLQDAEKEIGFDELYETIIKLKQEFFKIIDNIPSEDILEAQLKRIEPDLFIEFLEKHKLIERIDGFRLIGGK